MLITLKTDFFQLWVLFNSYLRVYSAGNLYIIVRNKHYIQALKKHTFNTRQRFQGYRCEWSIAIFS